ncbi:hypothetical protein KJ877_02555 [bacterium]|nr:hypothetical protein [bacterium]MBU1990629.1 hypothetical protein [bacterium]
MKNLVYLLLGALFFGGCSYKNESISLESYKADYNGAIAKENTSVYVTAVKDMRSDKKNIGYTLKNGKKDLLLFSDADFAKKYKEGLGYGLSIAEFNTNVSQNDADVLLEIRIKKIELVYHDKSFDENLKGEIEIEVVVKKGRTTSTQNFKEKAGKWIAPSYSSKDIEPFLYTLFSDSINNIISKLASK